MGLHRLIGICKDAFLALDNRLALNIRSRLIIAISVLFTVIMSGVFIWSYYSIEQYQKSEFSQQLADKAVTIADIMSRNEQRGVNLIAQLDKETRNTLYEERIFIYNESKRLIYSSAADKNRILLQKTLSLLEKKDVAVQRNDDNQIYGKRFENGTQRLYIIISAHDFYGSKTLKNVRNILGLIFIVGIFILVIFMSGIVQQLLQPLYDLNEEIDNLNENNLRQNISEPQWVSPEITKLTKSYNRMLVRIADAFDNQNQFVQYASHELRTPLAVMLLELENALVKTKDEASIKVLNSLKEELEKLIALTNSLLMLYKLTNVSYEHKSVTGVRVDEILFDVVEETQQVHKNYKINVELKGVENEAILEIRGNTMLLKLLFRNMIENAYKYAEHKWLTINIKTVEEHLSIQFLNDGNHILENEREYLFMPFFRAANSHVSSGFGVGLPIAKKIADYHRASISYSVSEDGLNAFEVVFEK